MNFCPKCGKKLEQNANYCSNCGYKTTKNEEIEESNQETEELINKDPQKIEQITTPMPKIEKTKINGFAIAGFVLSLCSVICCGLSSIIGLIFSLIGFSTLEEKDKTGKTLSILGIVISSIYLLIYIILYFTCICIIKF